MNTIKELFDSSKDLNRRIESVVTFADNSEENLKNEINEYVVTDKLHDNYKKVIEELRAAFQDGSNEVGVWVSGFYGSGKSSFAKYLGYSFQRSMMVDGISFGEKLMNRINDVEIKALHNSIKNDKPLVILIDLTTQATAGITSTVSDIIYYETLKLLGINNKDPKLMYFISLLQEEGKYEEFCRLIAEEKHKDWNVVQSNELVGNKFAAMYAPRVLPDLFDTADDYENISVDFRENETERFKRLINLVKQKLGNDRIIYVLDEVGQYVASSDELIRSMQGTMQILKSQFKGNVWLIATAQQTLTEDNPMAQLNSDKLFKLNDRFPIKVDIEADDIKEIITRRLLGKSPEGKSYLLGQFKKYEGSIKLETRFTGMDKSVYLKPLDSEKFANLYPFLPVQIDIILALLQKLASRTGGTGLRSVIRLIRDLLVEGKLAQQNLGYMATPDLFYDALQSNMEKSNDFREIVISAKKAIEIYSSDALAVRACKTIAIMQLLDDFNLSFDNLCSLLFSRIGHPLDKAALRSLLDKIKETPGITLQEIDGKFRFMTNAILSVQDERARMNPTETEKSLVLKEQVMDIFSPAPSVNIFGSKTINATVDLCRGRKVQNLIPGGEIKLNVRFVDATEFDKVHNEMLTESTKPENKNTIFWICTLPEDIEMLMIDIVKDQNIYNNHRYDTNKEIQDYLRAQLSDADDKKRQLIRILRASQDNSETICMGSPMSVNGETYKSQALKQFAESVFDKYKLAPRSMQSNVIDSLLGYEDVNKLPDSLNPFKLVADDGSIDTGSNTFAEIKDYIAANEDVTGTALLEKFSKARYGWNKDTIRYLVALMLKAGMIEVRAGAKTFKLFAKNAADAMKTNSSFAHLGFSLNTDATLNPSEVMNAMKILKELYNPQNLQPTVPSIAKAALKIATTQKSKIERLRDTFHTLGMASEDKISRAANYMEKIIASEGSEAPYLFAKDNACVEALRFVINVNKQEEQGKLLTYIKQIKKRIIDAKSLPGLPELQDLKNKLGEAEQAFNDLMLDPECINHTSEYADIITKMKGYIEQGCIHFYSEATTQINKTNDEIRSTEQYSTLTDEQKNHIESSFSRICIPEGETLEHLHEMCNQFSALYTPLGCYKTIEKTIKTFVEINTPAVVVVTPNPDPTPNDANDYTNSTDNGGINARNNTDNGGNDSGDKVKASTPKTKTCRMKRKLTTKTEVQELINTLNNLLGEMDNNTTIDLSLID